MAELTEIDLSESGAILAIERALDEQLAPFGVVLRTDDEYGRQGIARLAAAALDLPAREAAIRADERAVVVQEIRKLAAQLAVGWDAEPSPDPTYVAYGQAFQEAARRFLALADHIIAREHATPPAGDICRRCGHTTESCSRSGRCPR